MKAGLGATYLGLSHEQWALLLSTAIGLGAVGLMKAAPHLGLPSVRARRRAPGGSIRVGELVISDEARLRHTHIVGATGTGKTVLLEQLIFRDLERGQGALIIDPKGDRSFYERIRAFCRAIGRFEDLHLLSATHAAESVAWNPCRIGGAAELQSKFYNSATYSEPHYAKACELALLRAFGELGSGREFGIRDLVEKLEALSEGGKDKTTAGLFLDLGNLACGPWGELLHPTGPRREVSLLGMMRRNEVLFVDLPTEAHAVQSARVGRLLLQEIILISGLRKLYPHLKNSKPFSVFIDEFDSFATESFIPFLNKGRSSDFMIHLSHQTLSDLRKVSPAFEEQVMGNVNVRFVFRQDGADDAEKWSRFFGTRRAIKRTFQTRDGAQTGMSSNREVQEFRISPDSIKELSIGECIFGIKTERFCRRVKIPHTKASAVPALGFPAERGPLSSRPLAPQDQSPAPPLTQWAEHFHEIAKAEKIHREENS